ncbi:MAG: dockerin type I repeat-containing protein [Planctomycetes bacterium]|nr:dockerin type I repeat-containing protein [Planctomycetota bacterium]
MLRRSILRRTCLAALGLPFVLAGVAHGAKACPAGYDLRYNDAFRFTAESVTGVPGDVVPVTFVLESRVENPGWIDLGMAVCHDLGVARIEGSPVYSEELLSLLGVWGVQLWPIDEEWMGECQPFSGFVMYAQFEANLYRARFPSDEPMPIMTVYYRLVGEPGAATSLAFRDDALHVRGFPCESCEYNHMHIVVSGNPQGWDELSHLHGDGEIRIVEGEVTRPTRPPDPPAAEVYDAMPTAEQADFRVRIEGASARVGETDVPIEVYASAGVEYSAIQLALNFDERYLRLARAEDHFLIGKTLVDNRDETEGNGADEGHAIITSGLGPERRRIAEAGREVHAATLYFDVLPAAVAIRETALTVEPVTDARGVRYTNLLVVWYEGGVGGAYGTRAEIEPLVIQGARLLVKPASPVAAGDANADGMVDVGDAVWLLNYLFAAGPPPVDPEALDLNGDGRMDIADAVVLLSSIFGR